MFQVGVKFLVGVPKEIKPIGGIVPGAKVRLRLRTAELATAFVRNLNVTTAHLILVRDDDAWILGPAVGANHGWSSVSNGARPDHRAP